MTITTPIVAKFKLHTPLNIFFMLEKFRLVWATFHKIMHGGVRQNLKKVSVNDILRTFVKLPFRLNWAVSHGNIFSTIQLTRKPPQLHPEFRTHIFPGGRAPSQSDEMDIHFSLVAPADSNLTWKMWKLAHSTAQVRIRSKLARSRSFFLFSFCFFYQ